MSTAPQSIETDRTESAILSFLADHPRMIGVLFTIAIVLVQAGQAAGANSSSIPGP